jgi:hypothetical protein
MATSLKVRLSRLETRVGVAGRQWVVKVPDGMKTGDALEKLGITPADSDMVVVLRSFGPQ